MKLENSFPKRCPDLGLHVCFGALASSFFTGFLCLFTKENTVFPLRKGYVCLFPGVSRSFSLASFTSPFHSLSVSLYLSLSLSLSSFLFFLFLPCFLPSLFFLLLFLALFLCFCFMKRTTSTYYIWKIHFHQFFLFFGFLFCSVFQIPFSYLCFSMISVVCLGEHQCFHLSRKTILKHQALFCTLWKVIVFWGVHFGGKFGWCSQKAL